MMDVPRDLDILNDLRTLEMIDGIIKLPNLRVQDTQNAEFKRHGDGAIMLALGHYATRQDNVPIEFQATGVCRPGHGSSMNNFMGS